MDFKIQNHILYVSLVHLQTICAKYRLETWFSPNDDSRNYFLHMMHSSTINAYCDVNNKKWRKWCLFHLSYLLTLTVYLCSQWTKNVQIKYFMFDWSIYRLLVLKTGWKRDSLQIMIFVNICSIWSIVELKTGFETWITRNGENGVSLFHIFFFYNTFGLPVLTIDPSCPN
jgi:hypothetical protein